MNWSLYSENGKPLSPIVWIGGNQQSSVKEIVDEFGKDNTNGTDKKMIMYLSACGAGKSACIMNVIKELGRGIIVVPTISLQNQYKNDYASEKSKYILKENGERLRIGTVFGRKNFTCKWLKSYIDRGETLIEDIVIYDKTKISCGVKGLPCNRPLKKGENRISTGCACKWFVPPPIIKDTFNYWSEEISEKSRIDEYKELLDCDKIKFYKSITEKEYGLFVRDDLESVCDYYKQFYNYLYDFCDIIIYNKHKWEIETAFGRKPKVDIEAVDESDEFLNGLRESIDVSDYTINTLWKDNKSNNKDSKVPNKEEMLLEANKQQLLFDFKDIYDKVKNEEMRLFKSGNSSGVNTDFGLLGKINEFVGIIEKLKFDSKISIENNETLEELKYKLDFLSKYVDKSIMSTFEGVNSYGVSYNIPYPDNILKDLLARSSNKILFCSATKHSSNTEKVLYGIEYNKIIRGRKDQPGNLTIMKPKHGMVQVTYSNMKNKSFKEHYDNLLKYIVLSLNEKGNTLVITPAKKYTDVLVDYLTTKNANLIVDFDGYQQFNNSKGIGNQITISYKMKRGVDLRDDKCRVIIISKYQLPDVGNSYTKSLFNRFGNETWKILNDIAVQDTVQSVCRGLRHDGDYCIFSTPDVKCYDIVSEWWNKQKELKNRRY